MILLIKKICRFTSRRIVQKVSAAFTIIELIVVVGIFGIIMSVALANQQELNSSLLISNLGYEIGLIVRETQAYGIGVRAQSGVSSVSDFQGSFGVHIALVGPSKTADKIIVFKDKNNDGEYTTSADPAAEELFSIYQFQNQRGNKIIALCADLSEMPCRVDGGNSRDELNIIFKRPNPEASFNAIEQDQSTLDKGLPGPAVIVINTAAGKNCRAVIIEATGQIRIETGKGSPPICLNN